MELEALRQTMVAAKAKAEADPTNKQLQVEAANAEKAYNDAKAAADAGGTGGSGDGNGDGDQFDETKVDAKTKKYIEDLRKENAKHRTGKKEVQDKLTASEKQKQDILKVLGLAADEKPEDKIAKLQTENQSKDFRLSVMESAFSHGIPKDQIDYYEFLLTKEIGALKDGEELAEEKIAEIVGKVKKAQAGSKANSSVNSGDGKGGGGTPPPGDSKTVTLENFLAMSIMEKSKFYIASPDLYEQYMKQAKSQRKLV